MGTVYFERSRRYRPTPSFPSKHSLRHLSSRTGTSQIWCRGSEGALAPDSCAVNLVGDARGFVHMNRTYSVASFTPRKVCMYTIDQSPSLPARAIWLFRCLRVTHTVTVYVVSSRQTASPVSNQPLSHSTGFISPFLPQALLAALKWLVPIHTFTLSVKQIGST